MVQVVLQNYMVFFKRTVYYIIINKKLEKKKAMEKADQHLKEELTSVQNMEIQMLCCLPWHQVTNARAAGIITLWNYFIFHLMYYKVGPVHTQ